MKPDSLEKLQAALSVLNSCTMHQPPDENAVAVICRGDGHPDGAAFDEMARAVVEGLKRRSPKAAKVGLSHRK